MGSVAQARSKVVSGKSWVIGAAVVSLAALACSSDAGTDETRGMVGAPGGAAGQSAGVAGVTGGAGASGSTGGSGPTGGVVAPPPVSGSGASGAGGGGASGSGGAGGVGAAGGGGVGSGGGVALPPTTCDGADCWTYRGHDASSTYCNPLETTLGVDNVSQLHAIWMADTGSSAVGAPAVVGDTVFMMSSNNTRAFDRATGAMKWNVAGGGSGSATYDAGKVYVQRPNGTILRLDAASGNQDWSFPGSDRTNSIGSPLVVGNKVLVGTSSSDEFATFGSSSFKGRVWCLDKDTGRELWHHDTIGGAGDGAPVWSSPSADVELGMAFFTSGNNYYTAGGDSDSIFALDLETGEKLWSFQAKASDIFNGSTGTGGEDHDFGANPVLFEAGGMKLVGAGAKSGTFYAVDRVTGQMVWSRNLSDGCRLGGILNNGAYDGTRIYAASFPCTSAVSPFPILTPGTPVVAALNPADGSVIWMKNMTAQSWGPITVANGVLFVPSNKTLNALNAATGDTLFTYETQGSITSAPVVVDGHVYFGSGIPPADAFNLGGAADGTTLHALALP
jgi:polyvinyl alcohol dehydrogenase (cytochrome)